MKRSVRMPAAIPIRTRKAPATSSAERRHVLRCLSPGCVRLTGLGAFDRRPAPLLPKSKRAMAKILISHPARCAPIRERSANKFSSRNVCPLHKECVNGAVRDLCESNSTGGPLPPSLPGDAAWVRISVGGAAERGRYLLPLRTMRSGGHPSGCEILRRSALPCPSQANNPVRFRRFRSGAE